MDRIILGNTKNNNTSIMEIVVKHRNKCAHDILQTIELIIGRENDKWINVRKIILDSINDYHRTICDVFNISDEEEK